MSNNHLGKSPVPAASWRFQEQGRGPALLLLHGLGASAFSWRDNLGPLAAKFRLLAPDVPPHGASPAPLNGDYRLETLVQGLHDFLDLRGVDQAVVGGNSLGGSLALLLAHYFPERVKALILLAPGLAVDRLPWITYPLRAPVLGRLLAYLMGPWTIPYALRLAYHRWDRITPKVIEGYAAPFRDRSRRLALRQLALALRPWPRAEVEALLRQLPQPACLIWGEQDRILPPAQSEILRHCLPRCEFHLLPEVGHAPQEEAPERVNQIILDFLGG